MKKIILLLLLMTGLAQAQIPFLGVNDTVAFVFNTPYNDTANFAVPDSSILNVFHKGILIYTERDTFNGAAGTMVDSLGFKSYSLTPKLVGGIDSNKVNGLYQCQVQQYCQGKPTTTTFTFMKIGGVGTGYDNFVDLVDSSKIMTYAQAGKLDSNKYVDAAISTRLAPTSAGRTLDVTTGGEAGIDLSNVNGTLDNTEVADDVDVNTKTMTAGVITSTVAPNLDATITSRLAPTVPSRTLDVSAGGEAGIDWANVGSPATTVGLTNTTISIVTTLTNWDKTGYSLASGGLDGVTQGSGSVIFSNTSIGRVDSAGAGAVDAFWNELAAGHTTTGSYGDTIPKIPVLTWSYNGTRRLNPDSVGKVNIVVRTDSAGAGAVDAHWNELIAGHSTAGSYGDSLPKLGGDAGCPDSTKISQAAIDAMLTQGYTSARAGKLDSLDYLDALISSITAGTIDWAHFRALVDSIIFRTPTANVPADTDSTGWIFHASNYGDCDSCEGGGGGGGSLSCCGNGSEACTLMVFTADSAAIEGVRIEVWNYNWTDKPIEKPIWTNMAGYAIAYLDSNADYSLVFTSDIYIQLADTITVNTDSTWTFYLDDFTWPPLYPDTAVVSVGSCLIHGNGEPIVGARIIAEIPAKFQPIAYGDRYVRPRVTTVSDSAGCWSMGLLPNAVLSDTNSYWIISITYRNEPIFNKKLAVPDTGATYTLPIFDTDE